MYENIILYYMILSTKGLNFVDRQSEILFLPPPVIVPLLNYGWIIKYWRT